MNDLSKFEDLDKLSETISVLQTAVGQLIDKIVRDFFDNQKGIYLDLSKIYHKDGSEADKNHICTSDICYDGGNQPEYASSMYSTVEGFGINDDGEIYFSIEECDEYTIDRCLRDDIFVLSDTIKNILEGEYDYQFEKSKHDRN